MLTERPIVICDLDGVIVRNPSDAVGAITSKDYWANHWNNVDALEYNDEIIDLLKSVFLTEKAVMILTARPITYLEVTLTLLEKIGLRGSMVAVWRHSAGHDSFFEAFAPREAMPNVVLKMLESEGDIPSSSGTWKADVVKSMLDAGLRPIYMIEDYKQNADAVRKHIPVLLYEKVK